MAAYRKPMREQVVIDCFPCSAERYADGYAIVAVDVIRATTMATTAVEHGRSCYCADSLEMAYRIAARLENPLLAGELGGNMPGDFDLNNSPAELVQRHDVARPLVMLSSSGTKLMLEAARHGEATYIASFRNYAATAGYLAGRHPRVAVIGAGSRNEFREEDQMCCAWIAGALVKSGYAAANAKTTETIERWRGAYPQACCVSHSVDYLRRSGQMHDLWFILQHINDVDTTYRMAGEEVVAVEKAAYCAVPEAA